MRLSVCIATYNGEAFLPTVLPLILEQLEARDELIIVDDVSQDGSWELLQSWQDKRLRLFQNEKNQGAPATFFRAIKLARHEVIVLADQDDYWLSPKAAHIRQRFQTQSLDLLVHNAFILQNGQRQFQTLFELNQSGPGALKNFTSNCFIGCCMAFRRKVVPLVVPFSMQWPVYHDQFIGLAATLAGSEIKFDDTCLIEFNRHGENASQLRRRRNLWLIFRERFCLLILLLVQIPKLWRFRTPNSR